MRIGAQRSDDSGTPGGGGLVAVGGEGHVLSYADLETTVRTLAACSLAAPGGADADVRAGLADFLKRSGQEAGGVAGADASLSRPDGYKQRRVERVAIREKEREADYVASDPTLDSYGEIVLPEWDFSRFEKNPVILWSHRSGEPPIGHAKRWEVSGEQLLITVYHSAAWDLARIVWDLIVEGTLRAGSVGFVPRRFTSKEVDGKMRTCLGDNLLYEFSICSIPANPNALVQEQDLASLARAVLKKAQERLRATGFLVPESRGPETGGQWLLADATRALDRLKVPPLAPSSRVGAQPYQRLPLLEDVGAYSRGKALAELRAWASKDGSGDVATLDWEKFGQGFAFVEKHGDLASYRLPIARVKGGNLVLSMRGLLAAGAACTDDAEGLSPEDLSAVRATLGQHYAANDMTPPWGNAAITGDKTMKLFNLTATDEQGAALATKGETVIHCEGCGGHMKFAVPHIAKAIEAAVAPHQTRADAAVTAQKKAEEERDTARQERDAVRVDLAKRDLDPMVGTDAHHISPAERDHLATLSIASPATYESLVAERKKKFEAVTKGAGGRGEGTKLPTHAPDPTPLERAKDGVPKPDEEDPLLQKLETNAEARLKGAA